MVRRVRAAGRIIEYELRQADRRSVECRVLAEGVIVFAPRRMPLREIDAFVSARAEWILSARQKLQTAADRSKARLAQALTDGSPIPVEGKAYALRLMSGIKPGVELSGQDIIVGGAVDDPNAVREALRAFLIERARQRLAERTAHYSRIIGQTPGRITIREQKTKWGSCSGRGNLNFNWKLIMAVPEALDYVVIHELCHMVHLNHSPDFWTLVEKHMPDYRKWQEYLKKGIQSPFG